MKRFPEKSVWLEPWGMGRAQDQAAMSDVTARSSINLTKNQRHGRRLDHSPFLGYVSKQGCCELPAKGTGGPKEGRGTKNKDSPL